MQYGDFVFFYFRETSEEYNNCGKVRSIRQDIKAKRKLACLLTMSAPVTALCVKKVVIFWGLFYEVVTGKCNGESICHERGIKWVFRT